jgi:hypothetical protein
VWLVAVLPFRLDEPGWIVTVFGGVGLASVAAVLVVRVPENRISWLMLAVIYAFGGALGFTVVLTGTAADVLGTVMLFGFVLPGLAVALPLWFPTGRPPTLRWRWVEMLAGGSVVAIASGTAVVGWIEGGDASSISDCASVGTCAAFWGVAGLIVAMVGAVASFVFRWIRSEGVERAQLQWLVPALVVFGLGVGAEFGGFQGSAFANFALPAGLALIVAAIAVALLRYRLYDIGRLLRRSLSYGLVLAALAALYATVVLLPTTIIGDDQVPPWLVAVGTLTAFVLFEPLRHRVQVAVDRRFDRSRYDAQAVVEGFSGRVRDETDLETVTAGLGRTAGEVFRPESLGIWVRGKAARSAPPRNDAVTRRVLAVGQGGTR